MDIVLFIYEVFVVFDDEHVTNIWPCQNARQQFEVLSFTLFVKDGLLLKI